VVGVKPAVGGEVLGLLVALAKVVPRRGRHHEVATTRRAKDLRSLDQAVGVGGAGGGRERFLEAHRLRQLGIAEGIARER